MARSFLNFRHNLKETDLDDSNRGSFGDGSFFVTKHLTTAVLVNESRDDVVMSTS